MGHGFEAAHDEVIELGAMLLKKAPDLSAEEGFQVYPGDRRRGAR